MEWPTRVRDAVVESVLAGVCVGIVEGARVAWAGSAGIAGAAAIAAAASVLLVVLALVVRGGQALIVRSPGVAAWSANLRAGGATRTRAAWVALVAAVCVTIFAFVAFRVFAWAHTTYRFRDADAIGAVVVAFYLVLAAVLVLIAVAIDRPIRARLPATLLDGARGPIALVVALVVLVAVPSLGIARAVPAFDVDPVVLALILIALVIVLRVDALPVRLRRVARWGAPGLAIAALAGTWSLRSLPRARLAIVEHGTPSKLTAQLVWSLADGDGDGFPGPAVGGADCDDGDAARHPGATDIRGNGLDENCSGADAKPVAATVPAAGAPITPPPNIILISVDALRADRLGVYGYVRKTPVLDKLAAAGVRFTHAYTSCPSTRCAVPALHTGRFHPAADSPSLATQLQAAGYDTAAITCCERFAIAQEELAGFRTVDASADAIRMQRAGQSNADVVVDRALAWLGTTRQPSFLWVHLYEPHAPYDAPSGPDLGRSDSDRYDREVAFVDAQIGRLLDAAPGALVVVTADHGEELGEHGIRFHARSLYSQVIRVPLLVAGAGLAPRVIETPVSIVDIVPTLLELAGAANPPGPNGVSLVSALRGGVAPARPILVELAHDHQIKRDMAAVIQPPWKAIWDREANAWSLFRLDDLADEHEVIDDDALPPLQQLLMDTLDRETGR